MKSKTRSYTPGPWGLAGRYHAPDYNWIAVGSNGCFTARVIDRDDAGESMANARLIAAAPDLLEAVKLSLKWLDAETEDEGIRMPGIEKLRAAIAKAEER